ncbi:MAG: hypothetical protein M1812_007047 [Candelaria pacifica]|nr:MAG: hypothetical protein M1812_007047 [Candelaria pacifica]
MDSDSSLGRGPYFGSNSILTHAQEEWLTETSRWRDLFGRAVTLSSGGQTLRAIAIFEPLERLLKSIPRAIEQSSRTKWGIPLNLESGVALNLATEYARLGATRRNRAMLEKAVLTCQSALQGLERRMDWDSELLLRATNNLGIMYCDMGMIDKAEPLLLKARAGKEKTLGYRSISTLTTVNNLAILYVHRGRLDEARKLFWRSLAGFEAACGPHAPWTVRTALYLGHVFKDSGNLKQAEILYQRAKKGLELSSNPKDAAARRSVCFSLADLYDDQDQHEQADEMYREACSLQEVGMESARQADAEIPRSDRVQPHPRTINGYEAILSRKPLGSVLDLSSESSRVGRDVILYPLEWNMAEVGGESYGPFARAASKLDPVPNFSLPDGMPTGQSPKHHYVKKELFGGPFISPRRAHAPS